MKMESHAAEVEMGMGGSSGTPSGSRWNPTKEQISILENLYNQGIRTPNADQIQHLTTQLRAYGRIEGKNVFYWFQNHKARQRQKLKLKQKQQGIACFNRLTPTPQPIFSSPLCQNGVYWLQQNGVTFYPQQPKVLVAGGISPRTEKVVSLGMPRICDGPQIHEQLQQGIPDHNFKPSNQETLTLFPLHPTVIDLEGKTIDQLHSLDSISVDSSIDTSCSADVDEDVRADYKPFFDFFSPLYKGPE